MLIPKTKYKNIMILEIVSNKCKKYHVINPHKSEHYRYDTLEFPIGVCLHPCQIFLCESNIIKENVIFLNFHI
ncbi:hypothetical protein BH23THE1_BH23THE1_21760 [soil metagenome]